MRETSLAYGEIRNFDKVAWNISASMERRYNTVVRISAFLSLLSLSMGLKDANNTHLKAKIPNAVKSQREKIASDVTVECSTVGVQFYLYTSPSSLLGVFLPLQPLSLSHAAAPRSNPGKRQALLIGSIEDSTLT